MLFLQNGLSMSSNCKSCLFKTYQGINFEKKPRRFQIHIGIKHNCIPFGCTKYNNVTKAIWYMNSRETINHDDVIKWKHFPLTGGYPSQRPVTRSFDVVYDERLNKRLSKPSKCRWFETPENQWLYIHQLTTVNYQCLGKKKLITETITISTHSVE